jgi:hypothetical protein
MKAVERHCIRFTRSSIIVYPYQAKELGLVDGMKFFDATLHDVNGTGVLYCQNKTRYRGDYAVIPTEETGT